MTAQGSIAEIQAETPLPVNPASSTELCGNRRECPDARGNLVT